MDASDHIIGGVFGMAVGDALGQAVKGLKPETVRQCFAQMDIYKDVRRFIGKGVKQYRMQGLYGIPTQTALAVLDGELAGKNPDPSRIAQNLAKLSAGGPESGFGAYRHAESGFRKAVTSILNRPALSHSEENFGGGCLSLAVPLALLPRRNLDAVIETCITTCLLLTRNRWEVLGTAVWGALLASALDEAAHEKPGPDAVLAVLENAPECIDRVAAAMRARPELSEPFMKDEGRVLADALSGVVCRSDQEWPTLCAWIADNASHHLRTPLSSPAQGTVPSLVPLAFAAVLKSEAGFADALGRAADLGKEAARLGALTGSLAGVLCGYAAIPQAFKAGLVNAKEIRIRAEALATGRPDRSAKELHAMELALTLKEHEEGKKFASKKPKKAGARPAAAIPYLDEDVEPTDIPKKEDIAEWRRFQKDKTRKKRDRRRNLDPEQDWD